MRATSMHEGYEFLNTTDSTMARGRRTALTLALLCLAFLAFPVRVHAETADPEAADRAQYRQAAQAINEKNWAEAHRLLTDLWNRKQTFDVAASLGQTEYQL